MKPFGDFVNGAGAAVADVCNGFGESWNDAGTAFEKLCDGDVKGFAEKAADFAGDLIEGRRRWGQRRGELRRHAIEDMFS